MTASSKAGLLPPESDNQVIWRYLSYPKLLSLLSTQELRFTRADDFTDPLEGYLPQKTMRRWMEEAQQSNQETAQAWDWGDEVDLVKGLMEKNPIEVIQHQRKLGFVSCWNADSKEREELWNDYTPGGEGVVIKSTVGRLEQAIQDISLDNLAIGEVRYLDFEESDNYIFDDFTQHPLSYKHSQYEGEREIRAIVFQRGYDKDEFDQLEYQGLVADEEDYLDTRRSTTPDRFMHDCEYRSDPVLTGVDVETLIEEVRISSFGSSWHRGTLHSIISNEFGLDISITESTLDVDSKPSKPAADIEPGDLYEDIESEELLTLDDLANLNYELD